jgi:hypothetical protein
MAPEQASGQLDRIDERSDVFAVGAILYEVLVGHPPYEAETGAELLDLAKRTSFEDINSAAPAAPRALREICSRAMSPDPSDRYRTASELSGALEHFAEQAVAHQDTGAVGWMARVTTAIMVLMAILALAAVAWTLPRVQMQGFAGLLILIIGDLGVALGIAELATRGRYRLSPLIIALAIATFTSAIVGMTSGLGQVLEFAMKDNVFGNAEAYRSVLTSGTREALSTITTGGALGTSIILLWAVGRRRSLRS